MRFVEVIVCAVALAVGLPTIHGAPAADESANIHVVDGFAVAEEDEIQSVNGDVNAQSTGRSRDCEDVQRASSTVLNSGVYLIQPLGYSVPFEAYCDFEVEGEGWTVIQRRLDGSVNFDRVWEDYKKGFGNLETEFWLGNEQISALTTQKNYQVRFELTGPNGPPQYAVYSYFRIADESRYYQLLLGAYSGNAVDSMDYHRGMYFTTKDADHDTSSSNCAEILGRGGWWYKTCYTANLNADYIPNETGHSIQWNNLPGGSRELRFTEIKIRAN